MKKPFKIVLSICMMNTIVCTFPTTVFAYEVLEPNINSMITVENKGNKKVSSLDSSKVSILKNNRRTRKKSSESVTKILSEMGLDSINISHLNNLPKLEQIQNITTIEAYIKIDVNGNEQTIDEVTCLREVADIKSKERPSRILCKPPKWCKIENMI